MLQNIPINENFNCKRLKKITLDSSNHWSINTLKFKIESETFYCIFTTKLFDQDLCKWSVSRTFMNKFKCNYI